MALLPFGVKGLSLNCGPNPDRTVTEKRAFDLKISANIIRIL